MKKIIGRLCEAELAVKKIKFITSVFPKETPNATVMEQYDDIIRLCTLEDRNVRASVSVILFIFIPSAL